MSFMKLESGWKGSGYEKKDGLTSAFASFASICLRTTFMAAEALFLVQNTLGQVFGGFIGIVLD